jgi:hypothetical protein
VAGWWSPRTQEWVASVSVVFTSSVVGLVATARWHWVPHGGGPFGTVLPAPWFLYRWWFPLKWFDNCLSVVYWVELQLRFVFPVVVCV